MTPRPAITTPTPLTSPVSEIVALTPIHRAETIKETCIRTPTGVGAEGQLLKSVKLKNANTVETTVIVFSIAIRRGPM